MLLPGFTWEPTFEPLRAALWPADDVPRDLADEPPALLQYVETLAPDHGWLIPASEKGGLDDMDVPLVTDLDDAQTSGKRKRSNDPPSENQPMKKSAVGELPSDGEDMDAPDSDDREGEGENPNDDEDVDDDGPATIRYINLSTHPTLAIHNLHPELQEHPNTAFILRHEYTLFMQHALSSQARCFFVTGQPGIGKSFGSYYFLFRLLASGQSVFFINSVTETTYFSGEGAQTTQAPPLSRLREVIEKSWVIIDVEDGINWSCPMVFLSARGVVWTSSPQKTRMHRFCKHFLALPWYMKPWSTKEIAALTERYGIDRRLILERIHLCGLNTRMLLFDFYVPTLQTVEASITEALRAGNLFSFSAIDASQPVHRVFMIKPLVVINESSKRACLQRSDYSAEFLSAHIAQMTVKLAQDQFERVQHQLAIALNISITRSVAGKVVEGLMHRGFVKGMQLPAVFNTGTGTVTIKRTVELIGKAESFTCEPEPSKTDDDLKFPRPLYLRPRPSTTNFAAAVDAIVVTDTKLGFIQTSLAPHSGWNFWMMLRIMARLRHWHGAQVDVSRLQDVIYCLVGTDPDPKRLRELVAGASQTLAELKKLNSEELSKEFGMRHSKIAHARLARFRVVGYTFDPGRGFGEVLPRHGGGG